MKKIRYFFEALFLMALLGLSKLLPARTASNIGGWIGKVIGIRLAASRKAIANLKMVYPDKSDKECKVITTNMWANLGRVIMEYPHIKTLASKHTKLIGTENLEQYANHPIIFIAAHIGNWEVCPPAFFYQHALKVNSIYRPPNNPFVDVLLNKKRSLNGTLAPIPKSLGGTRQIVKELKQGKSIGFLIDQKYNEGVTANFMGRPARTADNFIDLAKKFNAPIIPLHIERLDSIEFQITVCDEITINNKTNEEILKESHQVLENWINKRPEQWLWLHRRWMNKQDMERYKDDT